MKQAVLSLSGGMDSSTLLLCLLEQGYQVTSLSFDYGQKHKIELEKATELVEYINDRGNGIYPVKHQIIELKGLAPLLNSNLVEGGDEVPEGHYEDENMKATVVPNRNKIFSSIIQSVALSIANKTEEAVIIAMGIHAGDHAIYPDCRQEFRDLDYEAFAAGNWGWNKVHTYTPFLQNDKYDILRSGEEHCKALGLDFDEVYKRTMTSYKPICITITPHSREVDGVFKWYSDYKSASSVERIEAFIKLGRPDPAPYANESGPVTWEYAKEDVEQVLAANNS